MPTLDISEYIEESVSALLNQTYSNFELLVLDGGSTDGTLEYLIALDDPRIRVFKNCGNIVESLNRGIDESRGEYIARADGDSIPEPNWLEKCVSVLEVNPEYAAVGTQAKRLSPDGSIFVSDKPTSEDGITLTLLWKNPMIHPTMVIRKQPLKEIGGYRERHWEDHDLVIRLSREYKLYNLSDVLLTDYIRESSVVSSTSSVRWFTANLRCTVLALRTTDHPPLEVLQSARQNIIPFIYNWFRDCMPVLD